MQSLRVADESLGEAEASWASHEWPSVGLAPFESSVGRAVGRPAALGSASSGAQP